MELFTYDFMLRAFAVAVLISLMMPMIGNIVVLRRLSAVGDALSHAGLAGVALGLCFGFSPVGAAVIFSVLAALLMEGLRTAFPRYSEIAPAVVLSLGVGIAAIASGFVKKASDFNSFLFGSIVAVSNAELLTVAVLSAAVIIISLLLYRELFYISFDEEGAKITGMPVRVVNFLFTVITAVTVAVASRTVGALVVSSLLVLPVACSMRYAKSYRHNMFLSIGFAAAFTVTGLFISYYADIKPGGTIVLLGVAVLLGSLFIKRKV